MVAMQRLWVFHLAVALGAALAVGVLLAVFGLHPIIFAGCAFMGVQPLGRSLFHIDAPGAKDERDSEIEKASVVSGYAAFWLLFTLFFVGLPFATGTIDDSMELRGWVLPAIPMAGWWLVEVTQSMTALTLYRRG